MRVGDRFGPRYHILKLLGVGGMGAVYQAWDHELGIGVALKVIRPDKAARGGDHERRFKRELLLARQVTHKHVIRIHDLGDVNGTKYISMPYVEGADLATVLRNRGALSVSDALQLARQIAAGLSAAHEAGVVHRDLKPANILVDKDHAIITDFGVAYSLAGPSERGIFGTFAYMAPEQARGRPVDHRADVYAFGLILFEMLAGRRWNADHTAEMQAASPVEGLREYQPHPEWPNGINRVLSRCLSVDAFKRYGSAAMLADDLSTLDSEGRIVKRPLYLHVPSSWPVIGGRMIARGTAAAVLALLIALPIVGSAAYLMSARMTRSAMIAPERKSILIADFVNRTGDAVFDQLVEPMLGVSLEGASFVDAYSRGDAQRLVKQIARDERLDVKNARLIAQREGIDIVLTGSVSGQGAKYRVDVEAIDPVPGTVLLQSSATASSRDGVLAAIGRAGAELRVALGDTTSASARLSAVETFTAASLEAAAAYSRGQEFLNNSRYSESIVEFQRATSLDPQFGRAYASWAVSSYSLGKREESEQLYKRAFSLMDRMSERERLRTYGTYYLTVAQAYQEAVTNYTKLVSAYPSDRVGYNNLAVAYFYTLNFPKAFEAGRRALELYPASPKYRSNAALYAMYSGDFEAAAREARRLVQGNPGFFQVYTPLAIAAVMTRSEPAEPLYERMAATGVGASRAAIGLADLALYEGRPADAIRSLPAAIAADEKSDNRAGAAAKYIVLAEAHLALGANALAVTAAEQALRANRSETVLLPAARLFIAAGREARARALASELSSQTRGYSRAYSGIVEADLALARHTPADAVEALRIAQKTADLWLVHFMLGIAYVQADRFPEALAEFDTCVRRRGEATAIFLDDVSTVRYLTTLPYWHGRAQEGLGLSTQAAAQYEQFLQARQSAGDALARDARDRIARLAPRQKTTS